MRTIGEAQKNMLTFTGIFIVINLFFLCVGALLYIYAAKNQVDLTAMRTPDYLYPEIALNYLTVLPGIIFMLGLTAATFATTDSALTALTTSFCVDFLGFNKKADPNAPHLIRQRNYVHAGFSVIMLLVIMAFRIVNDDSVVNAIFTAAGYTYGPLLGLFAFGILTRLRVRDSLVPIISVISPTIIFLVINTDYLFSLGSYQVGFELIIYNGLLTFLLLLLSSPGRLKLNPEVVQEIPKR